jgi:hypothetical protein
MTAAAGHSRLERLETWFRAPAEVMAPERLGAARATRHSFTASLLRRAVRGRWRVDVERWAVDPDGVGEAVYRVAAEGWTFRFVVFSTVIDESARTDRVVASAWDVTAALVDGPLDDERLDRLRIEVPRQEAGTADTDTLVWTRGNRSSRFFDHVAARLSAGQQPDPGLIGCSPYILRSTAYYGNGRYGMATYDGVRTRAPIAAPYRAQMLAAWLFREFSCDLVEHLARARSPRAVPLDPGWRHGLGVGNATGLGMVPFVISHPAVLDRWMSVREAALATARTTHPGLAAARTPALMAQLGRALSWCAGRQEQECAPFQDARSLGAELARLRRHLAEGGARGRHPFNALWGWAQDRLGVEAQEVLLAALVDLDDSLDDELEALLIVEEDDAGPDPTATVGSLRTGMAAYDWAVELAGRAGAEHWFWYYARDNEEPRRGVRGRNVGVEVEMPVDVPRAVRGLATALRDRPEDERLGAFLLSAPDHRATVARVQRHAHLRYAEVRDNLLAADFLPLQLQRFQLAMYGACEFVPQSTDWVRVTLMNGTPSIRALPALARYDHDLFPPLPE